MKKGFIVLLIVTALIVLVSPGIIGRIADQAVDENLQWAANESEGVVVTSEHYDRGWFSSEGRHRIEIRDPDRQAAIQKLVGGNPADGFPSLIVDTRLDHGLIAVTSMAREKGSLAPGLGKGVSTMFIEFPDGETFPVPGTIYTDIGLNGAIDANYVVGPGSHDTGEAHASWGPASVEFSMKPDVQNVVVSGVIDSISVGADGSTAHVGKTEFSGKDRKSVV